MSSPAFLFSFKLFEEFSYLPAVFQHNCICLFCLLEPAVISLTVLLIKVPDPLDKFPVKPLPAISAHIRSRPAVIACDPLYHPPQAGNTVKIQIDNGIALGQTNLHSTAVVSIHDPLRLFQFQCKGSIKFLPAYRFPVTCPPEFIQMNHRKMQYFPHLACKHCFSASATADNQNPFHLILLNKKQVCDGRPVFIEHINMQHPSRSSSWRVCRRWGKYHQDSPVQRGCSGKTYRLPLSSSFRIPAHHTTWS